jgi:hypothetical protein
VIAGTLLNPALFLSLRIITLVDGRIRKHASIFGSMFLDYFTFPSQIMGKFADNILKNGDNYP